MQYSTFLKKQSIALIDIYQTSFLRTFKKVFLWAAACFVLGAIIANYSNYDPTSKTTPVSILSFFLLRFSYNETYSIVDNIKTVFLFSVSTFSITLVRRISLKDIIYLLLAFITCALLDYSFFSLEEQLKHAFTNRHVIKWIGDVIFNVRINSPLLLFALILHICTSKTGFTFRKILFAIIALWFVNEFVYELMILIRVCVFDLILIPFNALTSRYIIESILSCFVVAASFLGYSCATTVPFRLTEENEEG